MCVYIQAVRHYWLSQDTKYPPSVNIEVLHWLSLKLTHISHQTRAYWWAYYRVSWMCNCFHCCWICMTFIYIFTLSFICTNTYTFQICSIINEQVTQLRRHFIIHYLVHQSYIVIKEEIDSTILCQYTDNVMIKTTLQPKHIQRYSQQTIGFQLWQEILPLVLGIQWWTIVSQDHLSTIIIV